MYACPMLSGRGGQNIRRTDPACLSTSVKRGPSPESAGQTDPSQNRTAKSRGPYPRNSRSRTANDGRVSAVGTKVLLMVTAAWTRKVNHPSVSALGRTSEVAVLRVVDGHKGRGMANLGRFYRVGNRSAARFAVRRPRYSATSSRRE